MSERAQTGTRLVVLGSGNPNPDPERMGPAAAIIVDDTPYLVDFGPGIARRCEAARRQGETALRQSRLKTAFLTHLHSDHTIGYPDLIFTPWVMGRDEPLQVYGPPGLKAMTDHILAAYDMDRQQRICGLEPINPDGYGAVAHEIQAGKTGRKTGSESADSDPTFPVYQDDNVVVDAFAVDHGEHWHAYGYRFRTRNGCIVVSGDTRPTPAMIEACRDCDILLHEVYSAAGFARRPPDWQRYHSHMHTSTRELARLASEIRPRLLVLTHQLFWGASDMELVGEIEADYDGQVVSARDLDCFAVDWN